MTFLRIIGRTKTSTMRPARIAAPPAAVKIAQSGISGKLSTREKKFGSEL